MNNKVNRSKSDKLAKALLTFSGEQDIAAFHVACKAVDYEWREESGGSRELAVQAVDDKIIISYKKDLNK